MAALLIIIVTAGILAMGAHLMRRLDVFAVNGGFADSVRGQRVSVRKEVLLYGEGAQLNEMCECLTNAHISYDCASEPQLLPEHTYDYVVALSSNDMDNLLLCTCARRREDEVCMIAKCNKTLYEKLFREAHVNHVLMGDTRTDVVLSYLRA